MHPLCTQSSRPGRGWFTPAGSLMRMVWESPGERSGPSGKTVTTPSTSRSAGRTGAPPARTRRAPPPPLRVRQITVGPGAEGADREQQRGADRGCAEAEQAQQHRAPAEHDLALLEAGARLGAVLVRRAQGLALLDLAATRHRVLGPQPDADREPGERD